MGGSLEGRRKGQVSRVHQILLCNSKTQWCAVVSIYFIFPRRRISWGSTALSCRSGGKCIPCFAFASCLGGISAPRVSYSLRTSWLSGARSPYYYGRGGKEQVLMSRLLISLGQRKLVKPNVSRVRKCSFPLVSGAGSKYF